MKELYSLNYVKTCDPVITDRSVTRLRGRTVHVSHGFQPVVVGDETWYAACVQVTNVKTMQEESLTRIVRTTTEDIPLPLLDTPEDAATFAESYAKMYVDQGYTMDGDENIHSM